MKAIDITNDLQGFRTVRTLLFHPRARELETGDNGAPAKSLMSGKLVSEPSEPETAAEAEATTKPAVRPTTRGGTEAQWLHVASQINAGEFDGAGKGLRASLTIGLRSFAHQAARAALARIEAMR